MRVLFLSPAVPSHYYGRRPFNMLRTLSERHEFKVLAFSRDDKDEDFANALREMGAEVEVIPQSKMGARLSCLRGWTGPRPVRVCYCQSAAMREAVQRSVREFQPDVVHFDRMRMAQYIDGVGTVPSVVDFTDALCLFLERKLELPLRRWERLVDRRERDRTPGFERWVLERCNLSVVSGDLDRERMMADHPGHRIEVIENTVDLEEFVPQRKDGPGEFLFVGSLFYYPNIDSVEFLLKDIWPLILKRKPDAKLWIGGAKPKPRVVQACRNHNIRLVPDIPDMAGVFFKEDVLLSPIRVASGTRFKLLEALSAEMGIVSTAIGAEGLPLEPGEHYLGAETAEEIAAAAVRLLEDNELRDNLGKAGRERVAEKYKRETVAAKLEGLWAEVGG